MRERPRLCKELDSKTFKSFYYLKEELVAFCKANGLPRSGGKIEISDRIAHYLDTGEALPARPAARASKTIEAIDKEALIEPDFVCSQSHRSFFKKEIGNGFSFVVDFQKWLKANAGKTYGEAMEAYRQIIREKKKGKTTIDRQFEYNTYIRDFFADNEGCSLKDAIACWNHKKGLQGHNRYERSDLVALKG